MRNLDDFEKLLIGKTAYFQVDAVLVVPDVTMRPASYEMYNILVLSIKDCMEK